MEKVIIISENELNEMIRKAETEGYNKGVNEHTYQYDNGWETGYDSGYGDGYDSGYGDGKSHGWNDGYRYGVAETNKAWSEKVKQLLK